MKKLTQFLQKMLLIAFSLCLAVPALFAEEEKECLVVTLRDNSTVSYFLEDTPVVTYVGNNVHVEANAVSDDHPMADVVMFAFEMKSVGVSVEDTECRITVNDNIVRIQGLSAGIKVMLSDIQGRVIKVETIGASGEIVLPLDNLNAGVYVVATSEGRSFKVLKH